MAGLPVTAVSYVRDKLVFAGQRAIAGARQSIPGARAFRTRLGLPR